LFPVDWPEPFGVVMIEAMACGTPVLAFRCGSIPEVIEDGVTGKMVDSEQEAVAALPEILSYDRRAVRQRFEDRFTATRMAKDYVSTYRQLLRMRTSNGQRRSPWRRRLTLNGGNGSIPVSIEKPLPAFSQAGANSEVDPIKIRAVDLSLLSSRDPETMRADEKVIRVSPVGQEMPDIK
jgi:Glycosyl transferases group 1